MDHNEMRQMKRDMVAKSDENFKRESRERLKTIITKKIETTMIGGLAVMEKSFGYLWGHGQPFHELTETQKEFREMWEFARAEYLDNGNNNLRASQQEIDQYTVTWNRYTMDLIVKGK